MFRYFIGIASLLLAAQPAGAGQASSAPPAQPGPATPRPGSEHWMTSETRIVSVPARVAFPLSAGVLTASRTQEFSHQGEGIDNAIQYRSPDGAIFGTVYVYYPGLPHGGLAAFASDDTIRRNSRTPVTGGEMRVVAAGGVEGVAIRADYANYHEGLASSAAFIKAGRWIIKLRVSGPGARRAEVQAAMTALLAGVQFGRATPAHRARPLIVADCPAGAGRGSAALLPDPAGAEIAAHALLATFDGGGMAATGEGGARNDLPPRIPARLCRSRLALANGSIPLLRAEPGAALSIDGRTLLVAMLSDSGDALELVFARNLARYWLLLHEIGSTTLLGSFDGIPSDRQIAEILGNRRSPGARPRVPVRFRPGQGPAMILPDLPAGAPEPAPPPDPGT